MDMLIKGARIVDCSKDFIGDVLIRDEKIFAISKCIEEDCTIINGERLVLLPSFIDMHAHFRDPGLTYKEDIQSGSLAAVRGGYTAVNLMANTKPVCSSMDIVNYVLEKANQANLVYVHQCVSITKNLDGSDISHLDSIKAPVKFISDDGKGVQSSRVMFDAMTKARRLLLTVISHAETEDITSIDTRLAENIMTKRDIEIAKSTGCHLHLAHVSTIEAMKEVIEAKKNGFNITCEVTPHHISLIKEDAYLVNPPLREREDLDFLIGAIKDGFIDTISTDHAPHSAQDKLKGSPGISGLETSFSVCYTTLVRNGNINLNRLSEIMSKNPAFIMGLNKGKIEIGYDADLVLVDIDKKFIVSTDNFASKGKNTPFEGKELQGVVITTIKGGRVVYKDSTI